MAVRFATAKIETFTSWLFFCFLSLFSKYNKNLNKLRSLYVCVRCYRIFNIRRVIDRYFHSFVLANDYYFELSLMFVRHFVRFC